MTIKTGNIADEVNRADLILVCTNGSVDGSGTAILQGVAKSMSDRFSPEFPAVLGSELTGRRLVGKEYNVGGYVRSELLGKSCLGGFQDKLTVGGPADAQVIAKGVMVINMATGGYNTTKRIVLEYPGVGNGNLDRQVVYDLLKTLDPRVVVYMPE